MVAFREEAKVAFLATWRIYLALQETHWLAVHGYCLRFTEDAIYGGKGYCFSRHEQGPHILLEVRVRSLSLSGSLSKFVHDRAFVKGLAEEDIKDFFFKV